MNSYIIENLKKTIAETKLDTTVEKIGKVHSVGDGVAIIGGLTDVMSGELLDFGEGVSGVALNLEEQEVGAMILGEYKSIKEGNMVKSTGRILAVPVGEKMVGRVVNALGKPLDGKGEIDATEF